MTGGATGALGRRLALAHLPTPLEPADRLGAALDMDPGQLWVKRDDCTGLAGGGNKARKLDYLCADALASGCDTLVTGGGRQSNHARMTAAASNRLGLDCTLVLTSAAPSHPTGNVVLDLVLGATIEWVGDLDFLATEDAIGAVCTRLAEEGRAPYAIPIGGASAVGALGYVDAARELDQQLPGGSLVVVADGSGGTHAGLAAGLGHHDRVLGVDVGAHPDLDGDLGPKAAEAAALAGLAPPAGTAVVDHSQRGAGYGATTDACRAAIDLAARTEGLILDPVYTGKAMAALIAARRDGRIAAETRTVFVHTGGMPALFATSYARWIAAGR